MSFAADRLHAFICSPENVCCKCVVFVYLWVSLENRLASVLCCLEVSFACDVTTKYNVCGYKGDDCCPIGDSPSGYDYNQY